MIFTCIWRENVWTIIKTVVVEVIPKYYVNHWNWDDIKNKQYKFGHFVTKDSKEGTS